MKTIKQINWLFLFTWTAILVAAGLFWSTVFGWLFDLLVGA